MTRKWPKTLAVALAVLVPLLYVLRIDADSISGLFGIYWMDEALYLLTAKNQILFGQPHPFPADVWLPELRVPLLHALALATITAAQPIFWLRLSMAACVIGAAALLGCLAKEYHRSALHGLVCFISILLSPVMFFYARLGMAEGLQFLTLAALLIAIYKLHNTNIRQALRYAGLCGALIGLLFVSKISAIGVCLGAGAGVLLALYLNPSLPKKTKYAGFAACAAGGLSALAIYFFGIVGMQAWPQWWHVNLAGTQGIGQTPADPWKAVQILLVRLFDISYFLVLMPVFALYFLSLIVAANKNKTFPYILAAITIATIFFESFYGSSIRRNFFGLAMLSVTFGFVCLDYLQFGIQSFQRNPLKMIGIVFCVLQGFGAICLLLFSIKVGDPIYCVLAVVFLLIMLLGAAASGPDYAVARRWLLALVVPCSLFTMVFEDFFTPRTHHEADLAMEKLVDPNGIVAGVRAPVYFQGKRRSVFTNCMAGNVPVDFTNDIAPVAALGKSYYITNIPIEVDPCAPPDSTKYELLSVFDIFDPENAGIVDVVKGNGWQFEKRFAIYGKQDAP